MKSFISLCIVLLSLFKCAGQSANDSYNSIDLSMQWEVIENNHKGKREFLSAFTISNNGNKSFPAKGWSIYFNFPRMINSRSVMGDMKIEHINGRFLPHVAG